MKNVKVSVIMSNYNYQDYIAEAIESVIRQTYQNWELIIVDDGSTDGSREIIDHYCKADSRIKKVFKQNGGQIDCFNKGFEISEGDIICTLDSDDYYFDFTIANKVELHCSADNVSMVDSMMTEDDKTPFGVIRDDIDFRRAFLEYGYVYCNMATSGLSFSRKALEPFMPLINPDKLYGGLDVLLPTIALYQGEVIRDKRFSVHYRRHVKHNSDVRDKKYKSRSYSSEMWMKQAALGLLQLRERGKLVPTDDFGYYLKIINDIKECINEKGVVVYGISFIGEKCMKALETYGIKIVYLSDSRETRVCGKEDDEGLNYPYIPSVDLIHSLDCFDKIVIASRQSLTIRKYLLDLGIEEGRLIMLPL